MLSVRLLVNRRLLVIKFLESQKLHENFYCTESELIIPTVFKNQLYCFFSSIILPAQLSLLTCLLLQFSVLNCLLSASIPTLLQVLYFIWTPRSYVEQNSYIKLKLTTKLYKYQVIFIIPEPSSVPGENKCFGIFVVFFLILEVACQLCSSKSETYVYFKLQYSCLYFKQYLTHMVYELYQHLKGH